MLSTTTLDVGLPAREGLVVVVTGAARGTGRTIAEAFGRQGRDLILCDAHSTADVEASVRASLPVAPSVVGVPGDITTDLAYPDKIIAALHGRKIAVFAHTAAAPAGYGSGPEYPSGPGGPELVFDSHFTASRRFVEALKPHMEPENGAMVLIASLPGVAPMCFNWVVNWGARRHVQGHRSPTVWLLRRWAYTSRALSKRCVQLYVANKSRELASEGLRVVSVSPDVLGTAMMTDFKTGAGLQAFIGSQVEMGKMGKLDKVASGVESLGSPGASYRTGIDVLVDGGPKTKKRTAVRRTLLAMTRSPPGQRQKED